MPLPDHTIASVFGLGQPPLATVLLLHALRDGSDHIDWMAARDAKNQRPLLSFRLPDRLDLLKADQSMTAAKIQDHRPAYLDYEGEVSGDRGAVRRVGRGSIGRWWEPGDATIHLEVQWESGGDGGTMQHLALRPENPSLWLVNCISMRRC